LANSRKRHDGAASESLWHVCVRFYDPATGRFNRLDPFAGNMQDPQSLHKYLYVHGDPILGVDPTGNFVLASFFGGFGGSTRVRQHNAGAALKVLNKVKFTVGGLSAASYLYAKIGYDPARDSLNGVSYAEMMFSGIQLGTAFDMSPTWRRRGDTAFWGFFSASVEIAWQIISSNVYNEPLRIHSGDNAPLKARVVADVFAAYSEGAFDTALDNVLVDRLAAGLNTRGQTAIIGFTIGFVRPALVKPAIDGIHDSPYAQQNNPQHTLALGEAILTLATNSPGLDVLGGIRLPTAFKRRVVKLQQALGPAATWGTKFADLASELPRFIASFYKSVK
ncbi:MAG TPA: RHS repeat-associated core domain-containing protein, partial [Pirellulaceae bacterium]|nr:RHS repeat-associated core domain-containing protein [Pirellulaceae bacterium]